MFIVFLWSLCVVKPRSGVAAACEWDPTKKHSSIQMHSLRAEPRQRVTVCTGGSGVQTPMVSHAGRLVAVDGQCVSFILPCGTG